MYNQSTRSYERRFHLDQVSYRHKSVGNAKMWPSGYIYHQLNRKCVKRRVKKIVVNTKVMRICCDDELFWSKGRTQLF